MTLVILRRTVHGWSDDLQAQPRGANRWPTEDSARLAIEALEAAGYRGPYRIADVEDLERFGPIT